MVGARIDWCIIILVIYLKAIHLSKWLANRYCDTELSLKLWTLFICIMFIIYFSLLNFLLGGHEPGPLQGVHGLSPTKWGIHQCARWILFLTCPTGKWCFLSNSNHKRTAKSILLVKKLLGLLEMMPGLVNASFSLPNWQAVKMIFFAPCPWTLGPCFVLTPTELLTKRYLP